jgi:hypothetical protein
MKNIVSSLAAALLICAAAPGMAEKEDFSRLIYFSAMPIGHFDFERDDKFEMILDDINYWVTHTFYDDEGRLVEKPPPLHHFCAVGYRFPPFNGGNINAHIDKMVVVYWKERGEFRKWEGSDRSVMLPGYNYADGAYRLMYSLGFRMADTFPLKELDKTVPLETSREVRENAEKLVADCEKHGKQYVIDKIRPPPPKDDGNPPPFPRP